MIFGCRVYSRPAEEQPSFCADEAQKAAALSLGMPERSTKEWAIAAGVFFLSLTYLYLFRDYSVFNADEGIVLQGAQRILNGQVIYRDFFSFVTPGSYYFTALMFKLFGSSITVGRTLLMLYGALFSVVVYLLSRRVASRGSSLFATYSLLVICLPSRFIVLHNWDSALLALLATYAAVWFYQTQRWMPALATGGLISLTILFEQSKGAGILAGVLLGFILVGLAKKRSFPDRAALTLLVIGALIPLLVTAAYLAHEQALGPMARGLWWPLRHYSLANRLPYGYLTVPSHEWEELCAEPLGEALSILVATGAWFVIPVLPFLALGFLVHHARRYHARGAHDARSGYYIIISAAAVGLTLSTVATGRPDVNHLTYLAPSLFPILAWVIDGADIRSEALARVRPVLFAYLLILFTACGLALLSNPLNAKEVMVTRRGIIKGPLPSTFLQYPMEQVRVGETMLVYPYQPLYSYLTATVSPTRFDYLQPGMHARDQFAQAASDLEKNPARVVLFDVTFTGDKIPQVWPATPLGVLAAPMNPMERAIFAGYRSCRAVVAGHWSYVLMVKKDISCPN